MAKQLHGPSAFEEPKGRGPSAPTLPLKFLLIQFWRDIFGKEVQSAATYSYLWMADQMGHLCIGILVQFIVVFFIGNTVLGALIGEGNWIVQNANHLGLLIVAGGVCFWEWKAFSKSKKDGSTGYFPLDEKLLARNAIIAAAYMVFGAVVGWGFHIGGFWGAAIFVAMLVVSLGAAPFWYRQKINWQKASMPYLSRLADMDFQSNDAGRLETLRKASSALQALITQGPAASGPRQLILAGPVGSGRTPMLCGIGTEMAFGMHKVRYISFDVLIELADQRRDGSPDGLPPIGSWGPKNIFYWPWFESQVLLIDDISPLIGAQTRGDSDAFAAVLKSSLEPIRQELSDRVTVWVFGVEEPDGVDKQAEHSPSLIELFSRDIQAFCGAKEAPLVLYLPPPDVRME